MTRRYVMAQMNPKKILFGSFQNNDMETALEYGRDIVFLKENNAEFK